jgi:hypothetical protein
MEIKMSCVKFNLIDFNNTYSGEVHGGVGDSVIAALSAEPETAHELELALARFIKPIHEGEHSLLDWLNGGPDFEPYDAGIVIVDLAARVVAIDSTYSSLAPMDDSPSDDAFELSATPEQSMFVENDDAEPRPARLQGSKRRKAPTTYGVRYHNGEEATDIYLPYRLPEDWKVVNSVEEYEGAFPDRRRKRSQIEWRDHREVLLGKTLCAFLASELSTAPSLEAADLFTTIHARWLTTAREDLQGRTPRELLLEKQEFIDFDLHSRQLQWSFTQECPPSLLPTSHAYRFGGFGTHEIVIYYDLVRLLLSACRARIREVKQISIEEESERLAKLKDSWLETTNDEYQHKSPGLVIEWERKRIPLAMSGKDAMVDDDCPVCQAMADDLGPYFWHLDGSAMDDEFEFSFHKTVADWEAERREWEEFSREYTRKNVFDKSISVRMGQ